MRYSCMLVEAPITVFRVCHARLYLCANAPSLKVLLEAAEMKIEDLVSRRYLPALALKGFSSLMYHQSV